MGAVVKLGSVEEAQVAISRLHRRKLGHKRINVTVVPPSPEPLPRNEVVSILTSVAGGELQVKIISLVGSRMIPFPLFIV